MRPLNDGTKYYTHNKKKRISQNNPALVAVNFHATLVF